ncbi:acyl-CoA dehydrogenase family protein [Sphingomonas sp. MMS24-JH45]
MRCDVRRLRGFIMDVDTFNMLRETVCRFVDERLVPNEDRLEAEDAVRLKIIQDMRDMGLFGLSVPEEHGGLGLTMSEEAQIIFELGRTAFAYRSVIGTTVGIGSQGIVMDGTLEQKAEAATPKLASGEMMASFALTEPNAGSDAASVRTTATRDGDQYRLNGTKRYITNAPRAGMFTVMARSEEGVQGAAGISSFIVPANTPGHQFRQERQEDGAEGNDHLRRHLRRCPGACRQHHRRCSGTRVPDRDEGAGIVA